MEAKSIRVRPHKAHSSSYANAVTNAVGDEPKKKRRALAKTKAEKDPNKPKKNLSAFMFFSTEMRSKVKNDNPDMKFGEIAKEIAAQWRDINGEQKKKFDQLAENDKKRYEKDMEIYKKSANTSARV